MDLHLEVLLSSPKAVCLELNIEWTDVGVAPRKGEEEQMSLGVALLDLCFLENSMENLQAQSPVQLKGRVIGKV